MQYFFKATILDTQLTVRLFINMLTVEQKCDTASNLTSSSARLKEGTRRSFKGLLYEHCKWLYKLKQLCLCNEVYMYSDILWLDV